jgi:hypothetical protein
MFSAVPNLAFNAPSFGANFSGYCTPLLKGVY